MNSDVQANILVAAIFDKYFHSQLPAAARQLTRKMLTFAPSISTWGDADIVKVNPSLLSSVRDFCKLSL